MIQLTRYRSFLSFSTLYHAHFFERICNDFHGLKFCSVILQFAVWEAYHVFLQGAGYPVLHHWVRSLQQRGLGQITADWDDGRQLTDDKWRMAYNRLQLTADMQVPRKKGRIAKRILRLSGQKPARVSSFQTEPVPSGLFLCWSASVCNQW